MLIYKNYKIKNNHVEIYNNDEVFVELPVCIIDNQLDGSKELEIITDLKSQLNYIVEKERLNLNDNKIFHLKLIPTENNCFKLEECNLKDAILHINFPKDTDLKEIIYKNGMILKKEKVNKEE